MRRKQQTRMSVALRKESVDRNQQRGDGRKSVAVVALRKESVDRNKILVDDNNADHGVALRKESVDRNYRQKKRHRLRYRRSPQGERG